MSRDGRHPFRRSPPGERLAAALAVAWCAAWLAGCAAGPGYAPPPVHTVAPPVDEPYPVRVATEASPPVRVAPTPVAVPDDPVLPPEQGRLALPAGRHRVVVSVPAGTYTSIGIHGPAGALASLEVVSSPVVVGLGPFTAVDEDRKLPAFLSLHNAGPAHAIVLTVEATDAVDVTRTSADADDIAPRSKLDLRRGLVRPRPLVGMPLPFDPRAGYYPQVPQRYQFLRADVVRALREALRQTSVRFRRNALALGDMTQWDGKRPAADLGRPRHISHDGGRDVDIALAASEGESVMRRRCEGVMVDQEVLQCQPATLRSFDALRMAYLLGLLIDGPTPEGRYEPDKRRRAGPFAQVESIFTDQLYIDAIHKALEVLRRRRWIHDEAFGQLGEEGILRPSAWHVDHVHIRFAGEDALVLEAPAP